jgi:hypothetical protein
MKQQRNKTTPPQPYRCRRIESALQPRAHNASRAHDACGTGVDDWLHQQLDNYSDR